jgi:hypothetical protein
MASIAIDAESPRSMNADGPQSWPETMAELRSKVRTPLRKTGRNEFRSAIPGGAVYLVALAKLPAARPPALPG